jgi:hypothetical protein
MTPDDWRFRLRSLIEPSGPGAPATPTPANGTLPRGQPADMSRILVMITSGLPGMRGQNP